MRILATFVQIYQRALILPFQGFWSVSSQDFASHWTFSGLAVVGVYLLYRAYKGQKVGKKQGLIFLGLALGTHSLFNSPFVELETELPLAIPVVMAITLYGFTLFFNQK